MEERKMKKKKKGKNFKKFLLVYTGIFALVMVITWVLLYSFIKDYEEGQPKHVMEELVSNFTVDKMKELLGDDISTCEFESKEQVIEYLGESVKDGNISYRKKPGEYTEATPVYELVSNKKAIAKVTLSVEKKNKHKFNVWTIGSVNISDYISGDDATVYKFTVPTGSKLTINGVEVKESYVTEANKTFSPCLHLDKYVTTVPTVTVYEVKGLLFTPKVEATLNGSALEAKTLEDPEKEATKTDYEFLYPSDTAWVDENRTDVESLAKNYGLRLINQLELSVLSNVMIGEAMDLVSDIPAIWAYKDGGTPSFQDVKVYDCRKYSDTCYSVEVYYNLHVEWPASMGVDPKDYPTSLTYCYVKYEGKWRLAYFVIN